MSIEQRTCTATTRAGSRCKSWAVNGSDFCALHGPDAKAIQQKGGKHKSLQHRLEQRQNPTLQGIMDLLNQSLVAVRDGKLTPSQGSSLAAIGSSILRVREQAVLEERLRVLESRLGKESRRGQPWAT